MNVTVSGYYGFHNTGDEAIALSISRELKARGHAPLLLSREPAQTAAAYGCASAARMSLPGLLRSLLGAQMVWSGGGGLLQDKTSSRNLTYYLTLIRAALLLGRRVVVFNQSIGPLSLEGGARVARVLSDRRIQVIVRDRASLETLRRLGVQATLGGDPALLLAPSAGLTPRPETVVLAPRGDVQDANAGLRTLAHHLRERGRHVVALSFHPGVDDAAAHALGADEVISTSDPQRALDTIAAAGYVVGVRLHAVILAAAAGVPFAGVSYDPKVAGFCDDAGAASVGTDFDPAQVCGLVQKNTAPDWAQVEEMRARARESFDLALK
ncbi:polysaccharide pyruvyl transferase CsaB [Deinococcus sp. KNUC1210]|uniref:polysaccharide pyruvyl transferase CsaB n=1 Tax=Deinococcus sp. KNUC1210 TaxID=2917691 RepID=UPI001EF15B2D|nr:polysaccharide pyruvyl transferase CsaB [Deinococcus sp. KNUC1210]ULH16502.1 polysaccharide pyruvyl transferase CsaB [Deinococcus sp. KNUC1210]